MGPDILQLKLIDLQSDTDLKNKFISMETVEYFWMVSGLFWKSLTEGRFHSLYPPAFSMKPILGGITNVSGRTMVLGSTQPLTEMSTRVISGGGKGGRCVGLTTLPPSCSDCLEILGASTSCILKGLSQPVMWLLQQTSRRQTSRAPQHAYLLQFEPPPVPYGD